MHQVLTPPQQKYMQLVTHYSLGSSLDVPIHLESERNLTRISTYFDCSPLQMEKEQMVLC